MPKRLLVPKKRVVVPKKSFPTAEPRLDDPFDALVGMTLATGIVFGSIGGGVIGAFEPDSIFKVPIYALFGGVFGFGLAFVSPFWIVGTCVGGVVYMLKK